MKDMLKVLDIKEWAVSHGAIIVGLILLSVGLGLDIIGLITAGIWVLAFGLCVLFGAAFRKLYTK